MHHPANSDANITQMSTPSSSIGLSNISTQQEASWLPGEGGRQACLFEDALKHDREDGGGLMHACGRALRGRVPVDVCAVV